MRKQRDLQKQNLVTYPKFFDLLVTKESTNSPRNWSLDKCPDILNPDAR